MWIRSSSLIRDGSKTTTNAVRRAVQKVIKATKVIPELPADKALQDHKVRKSIPAQNGTPGASFTPCGAWISSNVPYKKNSAVEFAGNAFVALRDTSAPPFAIAKFKNGSFVRTPQGYLLAGTKSTNTLHPDWQRTHVILSRRHYTGWRIHAVQ